MLKKVTYSIVALLILLIAGVVAMNVWQYRDLQRIRKEFPSPKPQQADGTSPIQTEETVIQPEKSDVNGGHTHPDGTFHAEEHPPYSPIPVQIPDNITNPDVAAAWERLEYISKNRHQWGNFSPRALELMEELTPMWEPRDHPGDHGEELMFTLELLATLRDPRSAELLVSYQIDSGVWGRPVDEALAAMGPAAIPALIASLNPDRAGEVMLHVPIDLLPRIVEQHRLELGNIVQHIIIPRLKAIAAPESPENYAFSNKLSALEALALLEKSEEQ